MKRFKTTDVKLRHRNGLWLEVEHLDARSENDVYGSESNASIFKNKAEAIKVAKRLGLFSSDFVIV